MKLATLLGGAALAMTMAAPAASAATPAPAFPNAAAPAAGLPLGPFQIQDAKDNTCADVRVFEDHIRATMESCDSSNLRQRFTYDPLTSQIHSVGQLDYCLQVVHRIGYGVRPLPCDATNVSQRWQAIGPDASGRYYVRTRITGMRAYMLGGANLLLASIGPGVNDDNLFRLPLV